MFFITPVVSDQPFQEAPTDQEIKSSRDCPVCNASGQSHFVLRDYDFSWRDGKIICKGCNSHIANFDAG